jgi:tripartite ATP-independent transporter DctM subunit
VNSVLIGGISGSSGADAAGTTKVLVPEMIRAGYSPAFSCAITAAGSILPNIIPPSIAMLIYASMADVSIARLFIAGFGPGLLLALFMMVAVHFVSVKRGYQEGRPRAGLGAVARAFLGAVPPLFIAVIIIGGIRFGVVTATEAGVLAALWAMMLGILVYRAYSLRQLLATLEECAGDVALIGFLIAVSMPFGWVLIAERMPQNLLIWLTGALDSPLLVLLAINVLLLVAGCLIDVAANLLIFVPLLLPLAFHIGMDPIHFGIMVIVNLMLGGLTPPVGILVYITATVGRVPTTAVFREVMVFFYACLVALTVIALVPSLSLGLWNLLE